MLRLWVTKGPLAYDADNSGITAYKINKNIIFDEIYNSSTVVILLITNSFLT